MVRLITIPIELEEGVEAIIGQGNFSLKTVDDIARALIASSSRIKVGVAMNDGGMKITRTSGNDKDLEKAAGELAYLVGAGHVFIALIKDAYPVNILNDLKHVHGVCRVFAASSNPMEVVIAETDLGRAVLGVVDGHKSEGIEDEETKRERRELLHKIGYNLG
uniref:Uncharacterized conserved protein n=1 Tax=uncultured euryarchaeote Alv-FOS5 TaxID=337891 RepID=Q3SBA3_9EURY|nr:uncharacterized conserved protein [uncultured euryarchaeote Alv-FOS5]